MTEVSEQAAKIPGPLSDRHAVEPSGGGRRVVAPGDLHESLPGDDLIGVQYQLGEKGALLGRADLHRTPGVAHLQHPEDVKLQ